MSNKRKLESIDDSAATDARREKWLDTLFGRSPESYLLTSHELPLPPLSDLSGSTGQMERLSPSKQSSGSSTLPLSSKPRIISQGTYRYTDLEDTGYLPTEPDPISLPTQKKDTTVSAPRIKTRLPSSSIGPERTFVNRPSFSPLAPQSAPMNYSQQGQRFVSASGPGNLMADPHPIVSRMLSAVSLAHQAETLIYHWVLVIGPADMKENPVTIALRRVLSV
ncbi:hypothetical protein TREMEDRAFT_60724 [Tremella mesenterica DSM 1558]|uniref:uncharacterized protein n=1 Tax=Tremella mesenterica (strain ATCC 24925 / CBS 8224 / DSM 1558 / NBRC 9311 / NRRL Y-6157 / RJB 2259-6 / UBC 559-6) TaxID=578456 RepID=UPI0003F492F3|nr:uncharacterized protein TREMEDRAFT_60724 [Tremella mesenterica DSM 1558]EIW71806.1 hypothetical protein TREMEDRAFT_60724 [Tremella mesenterica DSM 1558]